MKGNQIAELQNTWPQRAYIQVQEAPVSTNELIYKNRNRLTDIENNTAVIAKGKHGAAGVERGRGMDWKFAAGRRKLLRLEWIKKVVLYSTGNYIQSPGINHNGKERKRNKECTYVYIWITLSYRTDWHNTVNQPYFIFFLIFDKKKKSQ